MSTAKSNTPAERVRALNDKPRRNGEYVLYWMQMYRRLDHNHALDHALACAAELGRPLVLYEGLRLDYPWASERFHRFILEGMRDNASAAAKLGLTYWPFVATSDEPGRGLLRRLAAKACLVVTDDYPAFIVPRQSQRLADTVEVAVVAVDSNSMIPLAQLGEPVSAAVHLRHRIHRLVPSIWGKQAAAKPHVDAAARGEIEPPFETWKPERLQGTLDELPLDRSARSVLATPGGTVAGRKRLRKFVREQLVQYAELRNEPASLKEGHASGLSPYLHFGHIAVEEVVTAVLNSRGPWSVAEIDPSCRGKREGYFGNDADVNSFLDEVITWRDVGFHWMSRRGSDIESLERALPEWALKTLTKHATDRREHLYTLEQFEAADTHDELWNAAQRELVAAGRIHNYLRMLWGKKVIEWSASPEEAYRTLEHLNNKYALDGRDPNSYTGILWCFGLFDRPWAPERPVFGRVRFMSSENTARKFDLAGYLRYVRDLV